ncbi:MAG: endolytic transglycosylase MltG [Rhodospirillaceae bacterium]
MLRWFAGAFSFVLVLVLAAVWLGVELRRPGPLAEDKTIVIQRGAGVGSIGHTLAEAGVVRAALLFELAAGLARFRGEHQMRAGEYVFAKGESVLGIVEQMLHGRTLVHRFSVIEGVTVAQVVTALRAEPALAGEIAEVPEDGSLLPDTYHFSLGDGRAALLQRMHAAMTATIADLWSGRAVGLPLETQGAAVVLASIVEKETAQPGERARIAGVFYNRLASGMRLQSDPTVIYALTGGKGPLGRPLSQADWHVDSPFNTYQIDGLPPKPIGNPGRASLSAVLNPERHEFLYFVADGSGGHAFAKTLAEHNRNVAHWRQRQREHEHGGP